MSQRKEQLKIRKGFTLTYKHLVFKFPLQMKVLLNLQEKKYLSDVMFNKCDINLSGDYFQKWTYSGKILLNSAKLKQIKKSFNEFQFLQIYNEFQEPSQQQISQHTIIKVPFMKLVQSSKWQTAYLNFVKNESTFLLKDINSIQFSKLLKLQLIGNNLTSIQLLQTLELSSLQDINLCLNRITCVKSMKKLSCKNLKHLDLSVNFLNSDRTFDGLTKLDAQQLSKVIMHNQNNEQIFKKIDQHRAFDMRYGRDPKYNFLNQSNTVRYLQGLIEPNIFFNNGRRRGRRHNFQTLFQHKPAIQMIDYLLQQSLSLLQFRFLLKSNSCSDQLLNPKTNNQLTSPYQYFVYYSTNIQTFIQMLQDQEEEDRYRNYRDWDDYSYYSDYWYYTSWRYQYDFQSLDYSNLVVNKKGFFYK